MSYLSEVIADSPVHFWRFADQGGQIAHDIGSSPFHLTYGASLSGYSGPNSDGGSWFAPQANTAYSHIPIQVRNSPWSVECCAWPFSAPLNTALILAWDNVNVPTTNFVWNTNNKPQGSLNATAIIAAAAASIQAWHHFAGTYDGTTYKFYFDGALVGSGAVAGPQNINNIISWGANVSNTGNWFLGWLSEGAVYGSALSAARVLAHYSAIDQLTQAPVYGQAGGLRGLPTNSQYTSLEQQILQSVRRDFPTT